MSSDYQTLGAAQVVYRTPHYQTLVPNTQESDEWSRFWFTDATLCQTGVCHTEAEKGTVFDLAWIGPRDVAIDGDRAYLAASFILHSALPIPGLPPAPIYGHTRAISGLIAVGAHDKLLSVVPVVPVST